MLGNLIGYEMKAFGRIMLPLYAAMLGVAMVIGLGVRFLPERMYSNAAGATVIIAFVSLVIATMVMTGVLCVQRFYQNLLANEGYLMFSLPVGTHQLILSKVLGSVIWTALGGVVSLFTVLIMALSAVQFRELAMFLRRWNWHLELRDLMQHLGTFLAGLLIFVLLFVALLMQIYAALAVGHQWSAHRILGSVIAFFGFEVITNMLVDILGRIGIPAGWMQFMLAGHGALTAGQEQAMTAGAALAMILVYGAVTWYFLDRRLNLE